MEWLIRAGVEVNGRCADGAREISAAEGPVGETTGSNAMCCIKLAPMCVE